MVGLNHGFWVRVLSQFPWFDDRATVFGLGVFALSLLLLELLGPGRLQKPVAATIVLLSAAAGYYERNFGVLIDQEMVRNIFETTYTESSHMVTGRMVLVILLTGVLPAALIFWPVVRRVQPVHQIWRWPLGVGVSSALVLAALAFDYKDYSAVLRERHDVMGAYQPGATLVASWRYAREQWKTADPVVAPYGRDAVAGGRLATADRPVLLVLFVGETARAQNFGLNGYGRDTTPELAERGLIAFTDTTSCGTSTAVSVPCMFSGLGKAGYSRAAALGRENLLDVLSHAGMQVEWWDNNTGDQNVARRIGWNRVDRSIAPDACRGECTDEALLPVIARTVATIKRNTVLVLHMNGSHGPAYYLRYPEDRAVFRPDCRSAQFSDCTGAEIVNAYDNTIRETDFVLANAIDMLARSERVIPAMVYLSDHGESLGENGLYLHAAPAFMAPAEQTRVPFVMWLAPRFARTMGLDTACLQNMTDRPTSHDNLFASVLGLMDVETLVRDPSLDLTMPCRRGETM
ncbi:phosphatidylethanolamine--Kdo2-lipid A phosphoethanolamine transferase [Haematobacter missouriensis]|uniref:Phosphatidylethanolamine--Kdo2-lipid A phosphoethanolamine transferase n=2 Tax=Haematobacter missouriensis TaxID=366616 RepID=A0A212AVW2_9RHOB|nr:sulfatase-like hydrolase/transferase [Haematobacter missouriensis]OWJ75619.1 phosphatidylethanolamine--Kdo2-lipid A phosphoethanolamine transferase [Haematobacter missouriensis]OWJ85622.1 phosphatidylethanolamine--Kdo2-lipid A phosphoethanolamine transferase [Haematobacter missouriensis]